DRNRRSSRDSLELWTCRGIELDGAARSRVVYPQAVRPGDTFYFCLLLRGRGQHGARDHIGQQLIARHRVVAAVVYVDGRALGVEEVHRVERAGLERLLEINIAALRALLERRRVVERDLALLLAECARRVVLVGLQDVNVADAPRVEQITHQQG